MKENHIISQNRVLKSLPVLSGGILGISAILITIDFFSFNSGQLEPDSQMRERFEHHQQAFTQLSSMIENAHFVGRLCPEEDKPQGEESTINFKECKDYLMEIGRKDMCTDVRADGASRSIDIPMWSRGALSGGPTKGYLYSRHTKERVVPNLDSFAYTLFFLKWFSTKEGIWLSPLKDNWYLYYTFEK